MGTPHGRSRVVYFHREMVTILPERIVPGQLCNGDIMGA